jgi:hypothetical protein
LTSRVHEGTPTLVSDCRSPGEGHMLELWKKLNYREQSQVVVLNAPPEFRGAIDALPSGSVREESVPDVTFGIAFATSQVELDTVSRALASAAPGDAVLWFAYPKKSSRRLKCEFDRDNGWYVLGELGWEGVRQVAIDDDWSALRFRRVEFIRSFTRSESMATSAEGKRRASAKV